MNATLARQLKLLALAAVLLGGALATAGVEARPRTRVNVWFGGPFWWPGYWGPPLVVERPVLVHPPAEPLVVQPNTQAHLWYYCRDAQMYYPYVTSCPSPWQEVPATVVPEAPAATTTAPAPVPSTPATPAPAATPSSRSAPAPVPPLKGN
jgi:hypothetical protein